MAKNKQDPEIKTRRKLAQAQADLQRAQEKRRLAMEKGEQEVDRARQRAARRLEKSTIRVERRAATITHLESELHSLAARPAGDTRAPAPRPGMSLTPQSGHPEGTRPAPAAAPEAPDATVIVPDGAGEPATADKATTESDAPS